MLAKLQLELKTGNGDVIPYQKAVILQSILMGQIGGAYANKLHESRLHPYCQSVIQQNGKNIWEICTTNAEAYQGILLPLQDAGFRHFFMEDDQWEVDVVQKQMQQKTKSEFMDQYYFKDAGRYLNIEFRTPAAFKSQGEYVFLPELRLLYQSLMMKYSASSDDEAAEDEDVLEQLIAYSRVSKYRLRSCIYSLHGVRIPAFLGQLSIRVSGPQAMVNFLHMLFRFGEYSGIGIKTAMGMGNIKLNRTSDKSAVSIM